MFSENIPIHLHEDIRSVEFLREDTEAEYPCVCRKCFVWVCCIFPVDFCDGIFARVMKRIYSRRRSIRQCMCFHELGDGSSMSRHDGIFELFLFLEGAREKLGVYGIVDSVDLAFPSCRKVDYLHEELTVVPEKIEHREKLLYPNQSYLIVFREETMYANLIEFLEEFGRIHEASAIKPLTLLFLVVRTGQHSSGSDFQASSDSPV